MSDNQNDWETSATAQRRKRFFETAPSGSSRPADPSRDVDLPERPRRRQTPHPIAGTSGLDSQQQSDLYGSSSRDPNRFVHQQTRPGDWYGGNRAPTSYDEVAQDRTRRQSPTRSTTRRDWSPDGSGGKYEQRNTEQVDRRSGQASSNTEKRNTQVKFIVGDDVSYPKHYSPGSESPSVSDQEEHPEEPSGGQLGAGQPPVQVGQLRHDRTHARYTEDWEISRGEQQGRTADRIRRSQDGKFREEDTVRQRERRGGERSSDRSARRSGERSRRSEDRRRSDDRRSDEQSEERRRRDDSHERRNDERRRRRAKTMRDSGQASDEERRHHGRRRERSRTPPGKIEKFKNYLGFARSK